MRDNSDMNNTMIDRLKLEMVKANINETKLAKLAGVPQATVNRIIKGQVRNPRISNIEKMAAVFDLTLIDLQTHIKEDNGEYNARPTVGRFRLVPVLTIVSAGRLLATENHDYTPDHVEYLPAPPGAGPRTVALTVEGDSMTSPHPNSRSYPAGSIIFIDPEKDISAGQRVVARINDEYTFKCLVEDAGKRYLKPLNPQYPTIELTENHEIVGVIVGTWIAE